MAKQQDVMGIPDRSYYGRPELLPRGLRDLIIQLHHARRAGTHFDVRIDSPEGLLSWATRKPLPTPGNKIQLFSQPLHAKAYGSFEGVIPGGYGAGEVKLHERGKVFITDARDNLIRFTVAHRKRPVRYTMFKIPSGNWLLFNSTPVSPLSKHQKIHFKKLEADEVERLFTPENVVQAKIDGSATLYHLLGDKLEATSYRTHSTGEPIVHTERILGTDSGRHLGLPKRLEGSVLRGEVYGLRNGKAIPPAELGGLLNATLANSLTNQARDKVQLRNALFDIYRYGKQEISTDTPYKTRLELLKEVLPYLPNRGKFDIIEGTDDPVKQKELWQQIISGKHPLTREGIVAHPKSGGKPIKVKPYEEHKVYIREIVPGAGRLANTGAGTFRYSAEPDSEILGEVGTGFSDEVRKDMLQNPTDYLGRVARIRAQEQFPSGAYRAPAYIALHEDYPAKLAAAMFSAPALLKFAEELREEVDDTELTEEKRSPGNRTARMSSGRIKGDHTDHRRWKSLADHQQSTVLPWHVGRKLKSE